jgi:predicted dehydrogenase
MSKLKIGMVGLGRWGRNLYRAARQVADVTAICDSDMKQMLAASGDFREPDNHLFTDYSEMLAGANVDAVVIATPPDTHANMAIEALEAGKHVFVEKPMAMSTEEAGSIESAIGDYTFMVGHTFLYNDLVTWAKEYIDQGGIGRIIYATGAWLNWGTVRSDVDAFWNFAPHPLSILLYWLEDLPDNVRWIGHNYLQPDMADVALVNVDFGPVVAQLALSWICPLKIRQMMLVGDKATIIFDDVAREVRITEGDSTKTEFTTFGQFQLIRKAGQTLVPRIDYHEPLVNEMQHFTNCCRTGRTPRSDFKHGWYVTRIMERAVRMQ